MVIGSYGYEPAANLVKFIYEYELAAAFMKALYLVHSVYFLELLNPFAYYFPNSMELVVFTFLFSSGFST